MNEFRWLLTIKLFYLYYFITCFVIFYSIFLPSLLNYVVEYCLANYSFGPFTMWWLWPSLGVSLLYSQETPVSWIWIKFGFVARVNLNKAFIIFPYLSFKYYIAWTNVQIHGYNLTAKFFGYVYSVRIDHTSVWRIHIKSHFRLHLLFYLQCLAHISSSESTNLLNLRFWTTAEPYHLDRVFKSVHARWGVIWILSAFVLGLIRSVKFHL